MSISTSAYAPPDGGLGDFCLARDADRWHLFHIYREYGKPCDCHASGQEEKIGHAVSKDLLRWETRTPAIRARKKHWDSAHLWAPSVVEHEGAWFMLYTGMRDDIYQKIGAAISDDLETWRYPCEEPVIDVAHYDWTGYAPNSYTNCRDPYVFRWKDEWICYYTAMHRDGDAALGIAVSRDMLHWQDRGWALKRPQQNGEGSGTYMIESPCVFSTGNKIFAVFNQGKGIRYTLSDDPFDFNVASVKPFQDAIYNFEILDVQTGLFAYANGGYYSSIRFGYADFVNDRIEFAPSFRRTSMSAANKPSGGDVQ